MNATLPLPARGSWSFCETPPIYHATPSPRKTRVAVFGSFMGGYHVLKELLDGPLANRVAVVGVATDDPTQPFTNARKRLWQYPHSRNDELLVPRFAAAHGLPVFTGRVKSPEFFAMYFDDWQPQLCLMATAGQKIPTALITYRSLGFYNFHHSAETRPSYPGPDPIAAMVRDGRTHLVLTIHKVTDVIDGGEVVARSRQVSIPKGINAIEMHRITWPQVLGMASKASLKEGRLSACPRRASRGMRRCSSPIETPCTPALAQLGRRVQGAFQGFLFACEPGAATALCASSAAFRAAIIRRAAGVKVVRRTGGGVARGSTLTLLAGAEAVP